MPHSRCVGLAIYYLNNLKLISRNLPLSRFLYSNLRYKNTNTMQIFTPCVNLVTGEKEWNLQSEDYDFKQEIARSSYADMLHDKERNDLYFEGIRRSVSLLRSQGKEVHVLDIGTGTGLLSMMALSCGVDSVTACEAFSPMAECAKEILKTNGVINKVNLIGKRSTEIECGEGKEMPRRANLLVTEVFDTELIGEGAIETYSHAMKYLLTPDALFVPSEGTIYAQVISSNFVKRWNKFSPILDFKELNKESRPLLSIPESVENCAGSAAVHDVQLSEISSKDFTALSEPIPVFEFDWSGRKIPLTKKRSTNKRFESLTSGNCDAVFMWWDIKMDPLGEVVLSCAPLWDHPITKGKSNSTSSELPWRDHWMQAIYYFPNSLSLKKYEYISLISSHDEYSLWFNISKDFRKVDPERQICECGVHNITSRTRLGQLNDPVRRSFYTRVLKKHVNKDSVCLFVGDSAFIAILLVKLGARHVYIQETNGVARRALDEFLSINGVMDKVTILSASLANISMNELVCPVSLVFCEPYFETALLPWHSLQFLYQLKSAKHLLSEDAVILPDKMTVCGLPVEFRDLWKIRYPLGGTCSGFKMGPFDELIEKACDEIDEPIEPQPLWEYPAVALGTPSKLYSVPLSLDMVQEKQLVTCDMALQHAGTLNGITLWCEWHYAEECLTTGPTKNVVPGKQVTWDTYTRQGIYLFKNHYAISEGSSSSRVECNTAFNPTSGKMDFNFDVIEN